MSSVECQLSKSFLSMGTIMRILTLLATICSAVHRGHDISTVHYHLCKVNGNNETSSFTTVQSTSKACCARSCSVQTDCKSFSYNASTGMCHLHRYAIKDTLTTGDVESFQYCAKEVNWGISCSKDANCYSRQLICVSGTCQCKVGRPYDPKRQQCVKVCRRYGTQTTLYKDYTIMGNNDAIFKGLTLDQCKEKCYTLKTFTCKAFDYGREFIFSMFKFRCLLSKNGFLEVKPGERVRQKNYALGVRHCEG